MIGDTMTDDDAKVEEMLEQLEQDAWNVADRVERQGEMLHTLIWIFFALAALVGIGGIIAVLGSSEESDSRGIVAVALILGLGFVYVLCVIADLFANRSRLHGLQGKMEAVSFLDDSE